MTVFRGTPVSDGVAAGELYLPDARDRRARQAEARAWQGGGARADDVSAAFAAVAAERAGLAARLRASGRDGEAGIVEVGALIAADPALSAPAAAAVLAGTPAEVAVRDAAEAQAAILEALPDPDLAQRASDVRQVAEAVIGMARRRDCRRPGRPVHPGPPRGGPGGPDPARRRRRPGRGGLGRRRRQLARGDHRPRSRPADAGRRRPGGAHRPGGPLRRSSTPRQASWPSTRRPQTWPASQAPAATLSLITARSASARKRPLGRRAPRTASWSPCCATSRPRRRPGSASPTARPASACSAPRSRSPARAAGRPAKSTWRGSGPSSACSRASAPWSGCSTSPATRSRRSPAPKACARSSPPPARSPPSSRRSCAAGAGTDLGVMIPMVRSLDEVRHVRAELARAAKAAGTDPPPLGIMVELAATAAAAASFAEHVDFFSIGTNDLTADVLGRDRVALHPSSASERTVLTAVATVTRAAREAGTAAVPGRGWPRSPARSSL